MKRILALALAGVACAGIARDLSNIALGDIVPIVQAVAVPEPSTLLILGSFGVASLLGGFFARRRRA